MVGSNIPCVIRGFVACGWFGIQTMFGGLAIHLFLSAIFFLAGQALGWRRLSHSGFFLFWAIQNGCGDFVVLNLLNG